MISVRLPDYRSVVVFVSVVLTVAGLTSGCTPTFNWREVHADEQGYRVMFPAKPSVMTRRINLDGLEVDMQMQAVQVEGMSFAVGSVKLPLGALGVPRAPSALSASGASGASAGGPGASEELAASLRQRAVAAMRAQLVRNIHGVETESSQVGLRVIDRSGNTLAPIQAEQILANGKIGRSGAASPNDAQNEAPATQMLARFAGRGGRVFQAVVVGGKIDREQAAVFTESLLLVD